MATMHSLFFGVLLAAVCSVKGDSDRFLDFRTAVIPTVVEGASEYKGLPFPSISIQAGFMSPVNILTNVSGGTGLRSEYSSDKAWTLGRYQVSRLFGMEDNNKNKTIRQSIIAIASKELGIREATGNNDGKQVEQYLRYTNLSKGYEWCGAFISWCYGQAGLSQPRNPWSPALFPKARTYWKQSKFANLHIRDFISKADIFGIYGAKAKRINHVGLVKERSSDYLMTIEGNSNDRVESRRRHLRTIYAVADWISDNG